MCLQRHVKNYKKSCKIIIRKKVCKYYTCSIILNLKKEKKKKLDI